MRTRLAVVLLVATVLTFLQNSGVRTCDAGSSPPPSCCCCAPGLPSDCTGMSCSAPTGSEIPTPISLLPVASDFAIPAPAVSDAPPFELPAPTLPAFDPVPLVLASHPPRLSLSCILLI